MRGSVLISTAKGYSVKSFEPFTEPQEPRPDSEN